MQKLMFGLVWVVLVATAVLAAPHKIWHVAGTWQATQGNGYDFKLNLGQIAPSQPTFNGYATLSTAQKVRAGYANEFGNLGGVIKGDHISFDITWTKMDGSKVVGHYEGDLVPGAIVHGKCWNVANPSAVADWHASGPAHQ